MRRHASAAWQRGQLLTALGEAAGVLAGLVGRGLLACYVAAPRRACRDHPHLPHCEATKLPFRLGRVGQADPWLPSSVTYCYEYQRES